MAQFLRRRIMEVARYEAQQGGVYAKLPSWDYSPSQPFRQGYARLLKYFRLAAPDPANPGRTFFNESGITYLTKEGTLDGMPHWCGIFALYCIKAAGLNVGSWKRNSGISAVAGFRTVAASSADAGDVGYVSGHQHHFLIEKVVSEAGQTIAYTIEGNSPPNSTFKFGRRPIGEIGAFYSVFS